MSSSGLTNLDLQQYAIDKKEDSMTKLFPVRPENKGDETRDATIAITG